MSKYALLHSKTMSQVLRHSDTLLAGGSAIGVCGVWGYAYTRTNALDAKIERVMAAVITHDEALKKVCQDMNGIRDIASTIKARGDEDTAKLSYITKELGRWSGDIGAYLKDKTEIESLSLEVPKKKKKKRKVVEPVSSSSEDSSEDEAPVKPKKRTKIFGN